MQSKYSAYLDNYHTATFYWSYTFDCICSIARVSGLCSGYKSYQQQEVNVTWIAGLHIWQVQRHRHIWSLHLKWFGRRACGGTTVGQCSTQCCQWLGCSPCSSGSSKIQLLISKASGPHLILSSPAPWWLRAARSSSGCKSHLPYRRLDTGLKQGKQSGRNEWKCWTKPLCSMTRGTRT